MPFGHRPSAFSLPHTGNAPKAGAGTRGAFPGSLRLASALRVASPKAFGFPAPACALRLRPAGASRCALASSAMTCYRFACYFLPTTVASLASSRLLPMNSHELPALRLLSARLAFPLVGAYTPSSFRHLLAVTAASR